MTIEHTRWLQTALVGTALLTTIACGNSASRSGGYDGFAVGTYIGGGSMLTGPNDCTYAGEPFVGDEDTAEAATGPRFIYTPGEVVRACATTKDKVKAVIPTGVQIVGPKTVKPGATSDVLRAFLVAGKQELSGDGDLYWELSDDCRGVAEFSPVLGSQDTGGPDRARTLKALEGGGTCTVKATIETGSVLAESFTAETFRSKHVLTIK